MNDKSKEVKNLSKMCVPFISFISSIRADLKTDPNEIMRAPVLRKSISL